MFNRSFLVGCGVGGGDAHRYWRLYISKMVAFGGTYRAAIKEFELREIAGGATIATDTVRISARSSSSSYPPANAIDADTANWWLSDVPYSEASDYTWLAYEFPSPVSIAQYCIAHPYSTYGAAWQPEDFELQWSDNGSDWTVIPSSIVVGETFSSDALKVYTL